MPTIRFVSADNQVTEVPVEPGDSVMAVAVDNLVEGIVGECGGAMACATCHCYLDEQYAEQFDEVSDMEDEMLGMVDNRQPNSRLSCQLEMTEETGDLEIHLPPDN